MISIHLKFLISFSSHTARSKCFPEHTEKYSECPRKSKGLVVWSPIGKKQISLALTFLLIHPFFSRSVPTLKHSLFPGKSRDSAASSGHRTLVLSLLCTALANHGNFWGCALMDWMRHLHGGQNHNFREKIITFDSHSFKQIIWIHSKCSRWTISLYRKKSNFVAFFLYETNKSSKMGF